MSSLLLISGGLDSAAVAAIHKPTAGLFVDYGQRPAAGERRAARDVCAHLGLELHEVAVDLTPLGAGLLNPSNSPPLHVSPSPEWYPYRNQFLITIAAAQALALGHDEIWIGLVAEDETRHADGTTQFVRALDALLRLQEGRLSLSAPGHSTSTTALLKQAFLPEWLLDRTLSCHVSTVSCGECPGCIKRSRCRDRLVPGEGATPH
jgi:7-cyano-7-deazaguanine synthase